MPSPGNSNDDTGIARSLGEFFGHIWKGVKTPADAPAVRRERTETEARETPAGKVIVRRTIIEEVELPRKPAD